MQKQMNIAVPNEPAAPMSKLATWAHGWLQLRIKPLI
jgi:hypothetical protein